MTEYSESLKLLLLGTTAGTLNRMFGIGGGLVMCRRWRSSSDSQ